MTIWSCRYFAVSLPRRYPSSVAAQPRALLRSRSRNDASSGLAWSTHVARRRNLAPDVRDLVLERRRAVDQRAQARELAARHGGPPRRTSQSTRGNRPARGAAAARAPGPRPGAGRADAGESSGARSGKTALSARKPDRFPSSRPATRVLAQIGVRPNSPRAAPRPVGVSAKLRTAATIRSNSRARRPPACMAGRKLGGGVGPAEPAG